MPCTAAAPPAGGRYRCACGRVEEREFVTTEKVEVRGASVAATPGQTRSGAQHGQPQLRQVSHDTERTRRANERASRKQQQEWLEEVRRQNSRGKAGFANEAEARAALNGKGGRPSDLDRRKF
ncbi:MAG: hypothetical protein ABSC06_38925 [Rhodopila sp.]